MYHSNKHELRFLTQECDVKIDSIGPAESESDKKFRPQLLVFLGMRLWLHPKTSDSLRLRNLAINHKLSYFLVRLQLKRRFAILHP